MSRWVLLVLLSACTDGFTVGPADAGTGSDAADAGSDAADASEDVGRDDVGREDLGAEGGAEDAVADAVAEPDGGVFDPACPAPWLLYAVPSTQEVRRYSLAPDSETACAVLDGGGALSEGISSVTVAAGALVVASPAGVQGLDPQSDAVVWNLPREDDSAVAARTAVVRMGAGFLVAWTRDDVLTGALQYVTPESEARDLPIDTFFYDLAAADERSFWAARDPGERSLRDLSGARIRERRARVGTERVHVLGERLVSLAEFSSRFGVDDLRASDDAASEEFNPDECELVELALAHPLLADGYIVGCRRTGTTRGRVETLQVVRERGGRRLLAVVESTVWDAEIYAPE
ncbi:MAG: hypothetical protein AAF938_12490 [Myxococcota bacterium]